MQAGERESRDVASEAIVEVGDAGAFAYRGQRPRGQAARRQGTGEDAQADAGHGVAVHPLVADMDPGFRSPLIDFFRRGEVARDVRLLAAQGALAPRAQEQLALLVLLSDDPDPEIARAAAATLDALPIEPLRSFLARSDTPREMRAFFAGARRRRRPRRRCRRSTLDEPLLDTLLGASPRLPEGRRPEPPSTSCSRRCRCSSA